MPRVCGVMSTRTGPTSTPAIRPPWTAAPIATARSGSISAWTGRPRRSWSRRWTSGVRVAPPTRTTLSIWFAWSLASASDWSRQVRVLASRGSISASYSPRSISIVQVEGHALLLGDELLLDRGDRLERERLLGVLDGAEDAAPGDERLAQVDAVLLQEPVADVVEQQLVEVVAAEVGVAVAGEDLDDAPLDLGDRDVERAAAQVVDQQPLRLGRVRVVGEHGGGRLVDDPDDLQARQLARLAGRLPLALVEEGRDGDHGLLDRLAQRLLGALLERPEDDRRDLLRRCTSGRPA